MHLPAEWPLHLTVDWPLVIATIGDALAAAAAFFAWRALVAGKETTKDLSVISERVQVSTEQLGAIAGQVREASTRLDDLGGRMTGIAQALTATMAEIRHLRQEDQLVHRLGLYERISGGVHTIMLIPTLKLDPFERAERTRDAQTRMRAALAIIPGATGALAGQLPTCMTLSRCRLDPEGWPTGANVTGAEIEVEEAIRKVHEQLGVLSGDGVPPS